MCNAWLLPASWFTRSWNIAGCQPSAQTSQFAVASPRIVVERHLDRAVHYLAGHFDYRYKQFSWFWIIFAAVYFQKSLIFFTNLKWSGKKVQNNHKKSQTHDVALSALCANNSESLLGGIRTRQHTALRLGSPQHSTLRLGDPQHSTLRLGSTQHSTLNPGQPSALKTQTRQHSPRGGTGEARWLELQWLTVDSLRTTITLGKATA